LRAQEGHRALSVVSLKTQGRAEHGSRAAGGHGMAAAGRRQQEDGGRAAAGQQSQSYRVLQQKRQKVGTGQPRGDPHPKPRGAVPQRGGATQIAVEPKHSGYVIFFCTFVKMNAMKKNIISLMGQPGLTVKNGRLINNLPDGTMGIQAAANARKMRRREEKINMMADAYERAEMRSDMREEMKKLF